jgi:hypothetical protein
LFRMQKDPYLPSVGLEHVGDCHPHPNCVRVFNRFPPAIYCSSEITASDEFFTNSDTLATLTKYLLYHAVE